MTKIKGKVIIGSDKVTLCEKGLLGRNIFLLNDLLRV